MNKTQLSLLRATARRSRIPLQIQPCSRGNGTDAFSVRHTRADVPEALVSLPLRNMHSAMEVISLSDFDRAAQLLADTLAALPAKPKVGFRL